MASNNDMNPSYNKQFKVAWSLRKSCHQSSDLLWYLIKKLNVVIICEGQTNFSLAIPYISIIRGILLQALSTLNMLLLLQHSMIYKRAVSPIDA